MLRRKSNKDVASGVAGDSSVTKTPLESSRDMKMKKKVNSFRRIKGFITGKSKRERQAKLATANDLYLAETGVTSTAVSINQSVDATSENLSALPRNLGDSYETAVGGDDESTIFGVQVDDNASVTSKSVVLPRQSSEPVLRNSKTNLNATDSSVVAQAFLESKKKASPMDVLKVVLLLMDPVSRRFELLQLEFDSQKALVSDVLDQIPISVTEASLREQKYVGICSADSKEMNPTQLLSEFCTGNEVLVAMTSGNTAKECIRLARPILSDEKVVEMLTATGIDVTAWKVVKKLKKKTSVSNLSRSMPSSVLESVNENEVTWSVENPVATQDNVEQTNAEINNSSNQNTNQNTIGTGILVCVVAALFLQLFHLYISAPIAVDSVVAPGVWLSKCGLFGNHPFTTCEEAYLHISKRGSVEYYDSDRKMVWKMDGAVCDPDHSNNKCIPGLQFTADKKIVIGGKVIDQRIIVGGKPITSYSKVGVDMPLSPWPFETQPKVNKWLNQQQKF